MLEKPLNDISFADVKTFFDNHKGDHERKEIEYKGDYKQYIDDKGQTEFAKDVSSLANTSGGHIIVGFSESKGKLHNLCGTTCTDVDHAVREFRRYIRQRCDPRIEVHGVDIQPVEVTGETDKVVFVIRVAQSLFAPHAVVRSDRDSVREYWNRHSTGKAPMDSSEIRNAFVFAATVIDRMRSFRDDRLKCLHVGERAPVVIAPGAKCIVHLMPASAFHPSSELISLAAMKTHSQWFPSFLDRCVPGEPRINLDGRVNYVCSGYVPCAETPSGAYTQIYRNGIIESLRTGIIYENRGRLFDIGGCERMLLFALHNLPRGMKALGINPPVWVFVSVTGVHNAEVQYPDGMPRPIDRDWLLLPEFELTTLDTDTKALARMCGDYLWNAAGFEKSLSFDNILQNCGQF